MQENHKTKGAIDMRENIMTGPRTEYLQMLDLAEPELVEISISADGTTLWVNVNGLCRLRAQKISAQSLVINDERPQKFTHEQAIAIEALAHSMIDPLD